MPQPRFNDSLSDTASTPQSAQRWLVRQRTSTLLMVLLGLLLFITLLSIAIGSVYIAPDVTLRILLARLFGLSLPQDWPDAFEQILLKIRLPRVVLVGLTGATLACSGTAYQGLFRNPLADPYLIGVASGAGLGAIAAVVWQVPSLLVPICAFLGAILTVAVVYSLARVGGSAPITTLLLAGVAVGTLATACSTFLLLRMGQQATRVLAFLLGGYSGGGWDAVWAVLPFSLLGSLVLLLYARPLNLLLFDTEQARQLGIDVERVTLLVVLASTLMTAAAVSFSGLIGFVGLVVPHVMRLLVGADHRRLLPLSLVGGASFLLLTDLLARTLIAPEELPLGVVTAAVGTPFFLWLLRRARRAAFF